jgi:hypothetical protein
MIDFNKKHHKLRGYISLSIFCFIVIILAIISDCRRHEKLKHTENTEAVLKEMGTGSHYGKYVLVGYSVNDKEFSEELHCNCPELEVGDTILIRYSLKNPSTIALVKKFHMDKYKKKY